MRIPIARPLLGEEEAAAAARVVRSGWVLQGPEVAAFESEFAGFVGARHACATSSGTAALHLALRAVGVGPGDEVVTVSHSFIATANSVRMCGATPVFVDVEARSYNLDPSLVDSRITKNTRAILCVHQLGMPCDLSALVEIAARRGLALVEDAACALGSEIKWNGDWERIGRPHSRAACFSFHPRKLLTTGDGGMITTGSIEVDAFCRAARQHGDGGLVEGYNYRMTDVQAAIGRVQLGRLPALLEERRAQVARYRSQLQGRVEFPAENEGARSNWQSLCVLLDDPGRVADSLEEKGIATRRGIANAHRTPIYVATQQSLPVSEMIEARGLMLPLYPGLTIDEIDEICAALREARTSHG